MYEMIFHFSTEKRLRRKCFSKCVNLSEVDDNAIMRLRNEIEYHYRNGTLMLNVCVLIQWFEHFFHNEPWFISLKKENNLLSILKLSENKCTVEWNQNNCLFMNMVEKRSRETFMIPQMQNEYYVGVYGINYLRLLIPNFMFTFYMTEIPSQVSVHQEYIPGESFYVFMKTMTQTKFSKKLSTLFASIFFQVLCAIEIAQQSLQLTHHDLHGENIILRPCQNETIEYPIFDTIYRFQSCSHIPTLIDFEFCCTRYKKLIIAHDPLCYDWGIYPFFIPGTDILRFVLSCFLYTKHSSFDTVGERIHKFTTFLLMEFFQMDMVLFSRHQKKLKQRNFNFTMSKVIFRTPISLIRYCDENEPTLSSILGFEEFPFQRQETRAPLFSYDNSSNVDATRTVMGIQQPFPFPIQKYLFLHIQKRTNPSPLEDLTAFAASGSIYVPNLHINRRLQIQHFFERYDWFLHAYEAYFHEVVLQGKPENRGLFMTHVLDLTQVYRQAITIYSYHYFLIESLHGVPPFENDDYYYLVKSLFK